MPGRGQPWKEGGLVDDTVTSADIKEGTIALSDLESSLQETAGSGGHEIRDEGTPLTQREFLDFVGDGVVASDEEDTTRITIDAGYNEIQDEGTPLNPRPRINFIGAGVTASDNGGSNRTDVTIPGGSSIVTELVYSNTGTVVVSNSDTISSPLILARWAITNTLSTQNLFVALQAIAQGVGEVLAGGDNIKLSWGTSTNNGTTWTDDIRAFFSGGGETAEEVSVASFQFDQPTDIAVFLYGEGTNNGTVKGITALFEVFLPIGTTVNQTV